jgi:hypothetical protein
MSRTERFHSLRQEFDQTIQSISQLSGWQLLHPQQKRLITSAFYIQSRADRTICYDHVFPHMADQTLKYQYQASNEILDNWYCHGTIASLECFSTSFRHSLEVDDDFFSTQYYPAPNIHSLSNLVSTHPIPAVLHIALPMGQDESDRHYHSCLVLDHDIHKPSIFDKEGYYYPFRLVSLSDIYREHGPDFYYGIRPLRTTLD